MLDASTQDITKRCAEEKERGGKTRIRRGDRHFRRENSRKKVEKKGISGQKTGRNRGFFVISREGAGY
jgi:hypothetical protein